MSEMKTSALALTIIFIAGGVSAEPVLFKGKTPEQVYGLIAAECGPYQRVVVAQPNLVICASEHYPDYPSRYVLFPTEAGTMVSVKEVTPATQVLSEELLHMLASH